MLFPPQCRQCPAGGVCPGQGVVHAREGYFLAQQPGGEIRSFQCLSSNQCVGGLQCLNDTDGEAKGLVTCCGQNRFSGNDNPMCGQCLPGHSEWGGKCVPCAQPNIPILLLYISGAFVFMVLFHAVSQSTRADTRLFFYFVQMMVIIDTFDITINICVVMMMLMM
jgi:hypothetical protein